MDPLRREYLSHFVKLLKTVMGDNLVSVVLFGSVARGEAREASDIDVLVVFRDFKGSFGERFQPFQKIDKELLKLESREKLRREGYSTFISPIPLTKAEVESNPPIMLDILTDGIVLYDRNGFIKDHLVNLERKLKALKAKKVQLPGDRWYWDLKPDYKFGEVVEV